MSRYHLDDVEIEEYEHPIYSIFGVYQLSFFANDFGGNMDPVGIDWGHIEEVGNVEIDHEYFTWQFKPYPHVIYQN